MSEVKHTPEPWDVLGSSILDEHYDCIGVINGTTNNKLNDANAARIVACVNACEGLSNEDVARLPALLDEGTAAMQQRDELIAALQSIADMKPITHANTQACFVLAKETALRVLEKVRGGKS